MLKHVNLLLFLIGISVTAHADFTQGQKAFEAQDYAEAYNQWRLAADQGDGQSQFGMGQLFQQGLGIPQNFVEAHKYYNLAAAQGLAEARSARDQLSQQMTGEQIARAQDDALAWRAEPVTESAEVESVAAAGDTSRVANVAWSGISEAELAVLADEVNKLRALLNSGINPNQALSSGGTLLLQAVRNSSGRTIDVLLANGADPNLAGADGWTPLKASIYGGRTEVARRLLAHGADPSDAQPDGYTALAVAQRLGYADLIAVLSQ